MLNFIKPMWRGEEKLLFFRAEKLEKTLREKGKSPLPADKSTTALSPCGKMKKRLFFSEHKNWQNGSPMGWNLCGFDSIAKLPHLYN